MDRARLEDLLKAHGHKLSRARSLIIEAICGELSRPFSVDKAAEYISERYAHPCDRASVYRNLKLFERLGALRVCGVFDETTYFDFSNTIYIICRTCGRMEDITSVVETTLSDEFRKLDYSNIQRRIEYIGTCSACGTFKNE